MFEDFALERVDVGEVDLRVRHGGSGPPVLLLHGHPRTHTTWHRVAPLLSSTVILATWRAWADDVRGREVESGHHMAEEIPDVLATELRTFLTDPTGDGEPRMPATVG